MTMMYSVQSEFIAKRDKKPEDIEADINAMFEDMPGDMKPRVGEKRNRVFVELGFCEEISYSTASEIDDLWENLVKKLRDPKFGPVAVTRHGDEYDEGPVTTYIGKTKEVAEALIKDIEAKIKKLEEEKKKLEAEL